MPLRAVLGRPVLVRAVLIWGLVLVLLAAALVEAALSPLLAWRQPVYIAAGFAGVVALGLLVVQPLLAAGLLPGLRRRRSGQVHLWLGGGLVASVVVHVAGLWLTSPPDVVDVLLFRSPTPFSVWGVLAMWAVFAAGLVAAGRRRLRPAVWRTAHTVLVLAVVGMSVAHAALIEGTMGMGSKAALCVAALGASVWGVTRMGVWQAWRAGRQRRRLRGR